MHEMGQPLLTVYLFWGELVSLKKITVQGSSVKQRLMITGLVSWVIISTFYIGWKVWTGKCSQGLFLRKGVDLEWVSYTPLHLKSNPLLIPLLHKEWSVPNPIHPLPWSWVWSGVSRSEPVSEYGCLLTPLDHLRSITPLSWNEQQARRAVVAS